MAPVESVVLSMRCNHPHYATGNPPMHVRAIRPRRRWNLPRYASHMHVTPALRISCRQITRQVPSGQTILAVRVLLRGPGEIQVSRAPMTSRASGDGERTRPEWQALQNYLRSLRPRPSREGKRSGRRWIAILPRQVSPQSRAERVARATKRRESHEMHSTETSLRLPFTMTSVCPV